MYAAYILHTCTSAHVTHVCCTCAAHTIQPYCMYAHTQKLVQRHAHAIQAYEEMYAVCVHAACMLYINNCMYAAHNNCTHIAYMCATSCGMRVALSQFLCMQHTCNMDILCVQHACSVYAQYVQQGSRYMCSTQATFL